MQLPYCAQGHSQGHVEPQGGAYGSARGRQEVGVSEQLDDKEEETMDSIQTVSYCCISRVFTDGTDK